MAISLLLVFFGGLRTANAAASLYLSPAGGTFTVDSTFTVSILLNTGGEAINAVEANLSFPPDKLQVVSPSAGTSFVKTWIAPPTYSNSDGTLKFQGALPNPGINTESGLVSTVTFRIKSVGMASIRFSDTSRVLLNDGKGTDILDKTSGGTFHLILPPPQGPIVTSRTNPDQEKWYKSGIAAFEWVAPPDLEGYSYILDDDPNGTPDDISEGTQTHTSYDNVSDGIHYFRIKALRQGAWGGITTYELKIDRTPPAKFDIDIAPSDYTARKTPIISFYTTDDQSGLDHYELAVISLDKETGRDQKPFFIETASPYVNTFDVGHYEVIVRGYDKTGNYTQADASLTVVNPIFEIIGAKGIRLFGTRMVSWSLASVFAFIILIILALAARTVWKMHVRIEEYMRHGALGHPIIAPKLEVLQRKQEEYKDPNTTKMMGLGLLIAFGLTGLLLQGPRVHAALQNISAPEPPIITLYPKTISNDEIFYLGGTTSIPESQVHIYLEQTETHATVNILVVSDKNGDWFYSAPDFLKSGRYIAWAQLKIGDTHSPPSPQVSTVVAPTAFQLGSRRFNPQEIYFMLTLLFFATVLGLGGFIAYHGVTARRKNRLLQEELKKAEESINRGFSVLRRDIETELAVIRKIKLNKALSAEEKVAEEKLLKDLEEVSAMLGKEIWEIEKSVEG
ncbi:MAG: cohesin domain-containing protein [bacterium]|nr:cohesin domain-containing protein [bacterium]